jgi:hypothetical protein
MNDDEQVLARIEKLEHDEQRLRRDESQAGGEHDAERIAADAQHLEGLRVAIDRLWDYLRQRRALRDAGEDPDHAVLRDAETVERYLG